MADDSLSEMPDGDKPENIPLVVPDLSLPTPPVKRRCIEKNKTTGAPCRVPPLKGQDLCLGHAKSVAPELRDAWRRKPRIPGLKAPRGNTQGVKTREEILAMLSKRLDLVEAQFGNVCSVEVTGMVCDLCRTMALMMKIEASEDVKVHGWRMKGTG